MLTKTTGLCRQKDIKIAIENFKPIFFKEKNSGKIYAKAKYNSYHFERRKRTGGRCLLFLK